MATRIGGIIRLRLNGVLKKAKGDFSYNMGANKREMKAGADGVHGYVEMIQIPFIEGAITDESEVNVNDILNFTGEVVLELNNGKTVVLSNAVYASEGGIGTAEGEIEARFEGMSCREILSS